MFTSIAILCCFAFLAGFVEAVVGGGGLIQLPAMFLLMPQLSLLQTLATNRLGNFIGTTTAAYNYAKKVRIDWRYLMPAFVAAFIGSFSGALLVSYIHKEQFMPVIIVVLTVMLVYTVIKKNFGKQHKHTELTQGRYYTYSLFTGLVTGMYDGLIGPGTGNIMVFLFVVLWGYDFLHASANAKVLNSVANIAALTFFIVKGAVVWTIAIPIALANMLGSYTGSHIALKKGNGFVRAFFIIVVLCLLGKLGYDYLVK